MKRGFGFLVAIALAVLPLAAQAQVFGQWTSARTLPVNAHSFGAQLELSEHVVALMSDLRLSFYPGVDFGFQGGLTRTQIEGSNIGTARLAVDVKMQATSTTQGAPLDLAFGAFLGLESGDQLGRLVVGPSMIASRGVTMSGKERFLPYAGLQARYTQFEFRGIQRYDFSLPFRIGSQFEVVQGFRAVGEVQFRVGDDIDDHVAFGVGVDFDI
ncbi:MAG: hypothetical protein ACHQ52_06220 [Candidatus Eisenbacteria bacterium]